MSQFTITISSPESEKEFLEFVATHDDTKVSRTPDTNVDIYDENGNFKWVPLIKPGLKVPEEYLEWRLKDANKAFLEGRVKPWSDLRAKILSKIK